MASSAASSSSSSSISNSARADPILRNALRYTVSEREYKLLHRYLISQAPAVKKRSVQPARYEAIVKSQGDYNAAAIRASIRLFLGTYSSLKLWEYITDRFLAKSPSKRYEHDSSPINSSQLSQTTHADPKPPSSNHPTSASPPPSPSSSSSTASSTASSPASAPPSSPPAPIPSGAATPTSHAPSPHPSRPA